MVQHASKCVHVRKASAMREIQRPASRIRKRTTIVRFALAALTPNRSESDGDIDALGTGLMVLSNAKASEKAKRVVRAYTQR